MVLSDNITLSNIWWLSHLLIFLMYVTFVTRQFFEQAQKMGQNWVKEALEFGRVFMET